MEKKINLIKEVHLVAKKFSVYHFTITSKISKNI